MKALTLIATLGFLMAGGLAGGPIYQVNFTGTLSTGSAQGFNPALNGNGLTQFADLTGFKVAGSLIFDLGLAPAPTVTTQNGFTTTQILSSSLPVFVSETFTIEGLTVPPGFFAMPTVFDNLAPIPTIPSSTVTNAQNIQQLNAQTAAKPSAQAVLASMNFQNTWTGPQFGGSDIESLDVLISSTQPFFPIPPAGSFPDNWGPAATGQNGIFDFSVFSFDSTIPQNFGLLQWYAVSGNFAINSASGGFVTPEPGTLTLSGTALVLLAHFINRRRCRST